MYCRRLEPRRKKFVDRETSSRIHCDMLPGRQCQKKIGKPFRFKRERKLKLIDIGQQGRCVCGQNNQYKKKCTLQNSEKEKHTHSKAFISFVLFWKFYCS